MAHKKTFLNRFTAFLGSSWCFRVIVAALVLQAAWIALSGRYPMAFDEEFHFSLIRLYADHISPWWASQPAGADSLGAVARDPSFLYHWLMSFPYRLIGVFTDNQTLQVLFLRFINIGLFAAALPLFRRLLLRSGASKAIVNVSLAIFILLPITSLLAAQVNYDNLLVPVTALFLLLAVRFHHELRIARRLNMPLLMTLLLTALFGSLVKFAFLPIPLAILAYLAVSYWQIYRRQAAEPKDLRLNLSSLKNLTGGLLAVSLLLGGILFIERYGLNIVRYRTPIPACDQVLTLEQCSQHGPWQRDRSLVANKPDRIPNHNLPSFINDWFYGMWLRTFFTVGGPDTQFETRGPLVLPGVAALIFTFVTILSVLIALPQVLKKYNRGVLMLFSTSSGLYIAILWLEQYQSYLRTGEAVAINGRYLLPVLPLLFIAGVLSVNELLQRRRTVKLLLFGAALCCLLWGGGVLTYILRSSDSWYWSNPAVRAANHAVQDTVGPAVPGYYSPNQFMYRN